ncbi:MAG: excinuclease ABC subunit UvrA, partial [Deltaproteobacteria bacterium]|nr:excinuclease ABC subunit UvrA [Deltaproteobacteria bacterium]
KNVNVDIPRNQLVVITGLSGSGKSSLAFDTIYAEGQRRYVESLSAYARQFLEQMDKPDVDYIDGLSPAIAIDQMASSRNPRSTLATVTEIYDHLRLLFARIGRPHCPKCGTEISAQTTQQIVDRIMALDQDTKIQILAPLVEGRKGEFKELFSRLTKDGFTRIKIDDDIRLLDEEIRPDKNKKHTISVIVDRLIINRDIKNRLTDSMELALNMANGQAVVDIIDSEEIFFSKNAACRRCGISIPELTPQMFSFNNPQGACPECSGLGKKRFFDPELIVSDPGLSLREGAIAPWAKRNSIYFQQMLEAICKHYDIDIYQSFLSIDQEKQKILMYGSGDDVINFYFEKDGKRYFYDRPFEGVIPSLERRYNETDSYQAREEIENYMSVMDCPECLGSRVNSFSRAVKIGGYSINEITAFSIKKANEFFKRLELTSREEKISKRIIKELRERIGFLDNVGLSYLTLDRSSSTLSGGESQRIRLATQISSGLAGVLYVLDEPSIGLHQRDNGLLLENLMRLKDLGNTVLIVEHDEDTILKADYVIDMGPGAGANGGEVVFCGTPEELIKDDASLTGKYLAGRLKIPLPDQRRPGNGNNLFIRGAAQNNLKNIDVEFPLGTFICVTGVSGSGKSSLINETLYPALAQKLYRSKKTVGKVNKIKGIEYIDKVISIDQTPISRTPRSNPATYTGIFAYIRDLFAMLPESKARGYKPGRFSFNVKGGRCEACNGDGLIKIEMHFLPDVHVLCESCKGSRFNRDTLEIRYRGMNIAEVLDMTINQSFKFFENIPNIKNKLKTLMDVGLGYVKLGQSATTLSGGEAQRIKLSRELSKRGTGRTLYLLDEPTTGLHFEDIKKLVEVLRYLVSLGNTVIVIEHNLDVIKTADYVIDLGPEGGDKGGYIVAKGTPEEIVNVENSYTAAYLKKVLYNSSH